MRSSSKSCRVFIQPFCIKSPSTKATTAKTNLPTMALVLSIANAPALPRFFRSKGKNTNSLLFDPPASLYNPKSKPTRSCLRSNGEIKRDVGQENTEPNQGEQLSLSASNVQLSEKLTNPPLDDDAVCSQASGESAPEAVLLCREEIPTILPASLSLYHLSQPVSINEAENPTPASLLPLTHPFLGHPDLPSIHEEATYPLPSFSCSEIRRHRRRVSWSDLDLGEPLVKLHKYQGKWDRRPISVDIKAEKERCMILYRLSLVFLALLYTVIFSCFLLKLYNSKMSEALHGTAPDSREVFRAALHTLASVLLPGLASPQSSAATAAATQ